MNTEQIRIRKLPIQWLDSDSALKSCCEKIEKDRFFALDTEFERSRTFYPRPGLIQLCDGETSFLVDPISIKNLSPLTDLLEDERIIKVLHSCSEDLDVIHHLLGIVPENILDTQLAAGMLGYGFSPGFGRLVEHMFAVILPKDVTRSNWLQRPLSDKQIEYAALDVEYLYLIAKQFLVELEEKNRLAWINDDYERQRQSYFKMLDPAQAYTRFKSSWKLRPHQYLALKKLAEWREIKARQRDVPRNRILKDAELFDIAKYLPSSKEELSAKIGIKARQVRADGDAIVLLLDEVKAHDDDSLPPPPSRPGVNRGLNKDSDLLGELKKLVHEQADALAVAPEILAKNKDYQALMAALKSGGEVAAPLPACLKGWRASMIGEKLLARVKEHHTTVNVNTSSKNENS